MLQSFPKNPWLHLQLKLFVSHNPLPEQPLGHVFIEQSSPVHSASQMHLPSLVHFPFP